MAGKDEEEVNSPPENVDKEDGEGEDGEKTERVVRLPLTRIKHIIKMDPDVTLASQDAVILIAKATELFVQRLAKEAYSHTLHSKRKTVQKKDLDLAVDNVEILAFLEGTMDS